MFGFEFVRKSELRALREEMTVYKRELEDIGWINFSMDPNNQMGLYPGGFKKMIQNCRLYYYKNPLAALWLNLTTYFVFGEGISTPKSENEEIQKIINSFWDDPDNRIALTSFMAQQLLSNKIQYEGNLFFLLFDDEVGNVKVRILNTLEVDEIISDPEDRMRPIFYKVMQYDKTFDFAAGSYKSTANKFVYYPSIDNYDPSSYGIAAEKLRLDARVYHVKINCDINDKFGVPELFRGIDWIKAHKDMAEDLATLIKALSQYAWKKKIKGTASQVSAIASALRSTTNLKNIQNTAGQMQVENEGVDLQSIDIKTGGVKVGTDGLRQMKLMVCAASGIYEHYFGDPSTGNLATAKTMELPMVKKFASYQSLWSDVFSTIIMYQVVKKMEIGELSVGKVIDDPKNKRRIVQMNDDSDKTIDTDFPPILEADIKEWADGLKTGKDSNLVSDETAATLFLMALNVNNIDEELEKISEDKERKAKEQADMFKAGANDDPNDKIVDDKNKPTTTPRFKESIAVPKKDKIALRSQKKQNYLLQKINGYRRVIASHFNTMVNDIKENTKVYNDNGKFVTHVVDYENIVHRFLEGMRSAARQYYPMAVQIGEKYMQSVLKDVMPGFSVQESLYEAKGTAKKILNERLRLNDNYLFDKLEPSMMESFEKTVRKTYLTEDAAIAAVSAAVKGYESRIELYVGALWTVEQEAVKEAGRGTGVEVNFVGPDDDHNCPGCEDAVNGGPYKIEDAPIPGEQDCLGRCRHALQVVVE